MSDEKPTESPAESPAETPAEEVPTGELVAPAAIKKPDRTKVKDAEDAIRKEMEGIDAQMKKINDKAKSLQQASSGKDEGLTEARSKLKELKGQREGLMAQRTAIYGARDAARESRDAKMSEMRDLKSQTKFKDVGEIDSKIKKLETAQATTSMSLSKEKEVLKEIDELKKQRRVLAQHMAVASDLDGGKVATADHGASIKEINEQLSGIKAEMEKLQAEVNKFYDKKNDSAYPALMKEKDALRAAKKEKIDAIQALWDGFKDANKVWKDNQGEWDKFKKLRGLKEKAEYEARKKELAAARAAELAKKTPYEEEMALCDYLSNYLTTTFLGKSAEEKAAEAAPAAAAVAGFEGMTMTASKKDDGDFYMQPSGSQKKGPKKKGGKKAVGGTKRGKIVIFPETLESFGLLKMAPPTSVEQVEETVKALKAKKAAFETMPRGAMLSIAEMNQKYEVEAESRPRNRDTDKPKGPKKAGNAGASIKKVDVTSTELFPTLGGSKPAAAAPAAAAEEEKA